MAIKLILNRSQGYTSPTSENAQTTVTMARDTLAKISKIKQKFEILQLRRGKSQNKFSQKWQANYFSKKHSKNRKMRETIGISSRTQTELS